MTRRRGVAALLGAAAVVALVLAGPAAAAFRDSGTATSGSVTTLTLRPPTATDGTGGCTVLGLAGSPRIDLAWEPDDQVVAGGAGWGQQVLVVTSTGTVLLAVTSEEVTASSRSARITGTRTVVGGPVLPLQALMSYTLRVRTTLGGWHSADTSGASDSLIVPLC